MPAHASAATSHQGLNPRSRAWKPPSAPNSIQPRPTIWSQGAIPKSVKAPGLRDSHWSPEGGESLDDVRRRAIEAIGSLRDRYAREEIVVVTHGAVIQAVCGVSVPPN